MSGTEGKTFLIVGLGMMGGSYAMALTRQGYAVDALDRNPFSLEWALENGLIRRGGSEAEAGPLLAEADVIVLALYPWDILPWLEAHKPFFKKGALVTDLAGVKGSIVPAAQALLAPDFEYIPCHPMAGREKSGVQYADEAIFHGANFLITPTGHNTPAAVAFARELAGLLGFGRVTELSVEEHDRMIGYVSQLTHAIAVSLMVANDDERLPEVTGDSFRDLTRIADINAELWSGLFLANVPALTEEIDTFIACLQRLRGYLAAEDATALQEMMAQSAERRQLFNNR